MEIKDKYANLIDDHVVSIFDTFAASIKLLKTMKSILKLNESSSV